MKLHRFNESGISKFSEYLDSLKQDPTLSPPQDLLLDPALVVPATGGTDLEARNFSNRHDAAIYLDAALKDVTGCDVQHDAGLWAWITLFFFDAVCPADGHGRRKVGERARYVPAVTNYLKYYRHLLAGPYRVLRAHREHPEHAMILLCGPVSKPGDIVEQIVARQEVITNPNAVEVATKIYFDPDRNTFRRGAAGKGGGSARRFADVLNQFDVTWDLYSMPAEQILQKLPREFDRFRTQ